VLAFSGKLSCEKREDAVRKIRFSVEQIVAVLKQVEMGLPVADVMRQLGISEQTFYRWKKLYSGLQPDQARELKQLQEENTRLSVPDVISPEVSFEISPV
jgi:putative transposase